ncbi:MAG: hypothetical protein RR292_07855, partial [Christensenellaceae bacterium]
MMKIKKTADEIWKEYSRGITYNESLNLYENIKQNNNFYNDKQWEGVIAPDLPKPVFNFLKPVVNYYIAMLISDDIATNIEIMGEQDEYIPKMLSTEIDNIMESANVKFKNRKMIKNCAIDGDACFYMWFDTDTNSIKVDLIDNTNVLFGNPSESEVQEQQ